MEYGIGQEKKEEERTRGLATMVREAKQRDWKKYNTFRKDEYRLILPIVAEMVNKAEQAYKVKRRRKTQQEGLQLTLAL